MIISTIISFFLLITLIKGAPTILCKSDGNQIVTFPGSKNHPTTISSVDYAARGYPGILDALWVWDGSNVIANCSNPIAIQEKFITYCNQDITVEIIGDFYFQLWVNDEYFKGQWPTRYKFPIKNTKLNGCGMENKIRIIAKNDGPCSFPNPGGVNYVVSQETEKCFECPRNQYYNVNSCSCECKPQSCCQAPFVYTPFPVCACACKPPKESCQAKGFGPNSYFDQNQCTCNCRPKVCNEGFYYNQNMCVCQKCVERKCEIDTDILNMNTCKCQSKCPGSKQCSKDYQYDYNRCKCIPIIKCKKKTCEDEQIFNQKDCKCVKKIDQNKRKP